MKKYIIIASAVILSAVSCRNWLDVKPRGYDIPTTIEQYEGLLYGTEHFYLDEVFEFMSFEFTNDTDSYALAYSSMGSAVCNAYKWSKDIFLPDENCGEWNVPCSFLYPLNVVIAEVMDATDASQEKKAAIRAEARMMRAWQHFTLAQFFAPPYYKDKASQTPCIPLITTASTVGAEFPRKTMAEVYSFILDEMKESVELLPDEKEHYLRVFKASGYAMLGKVLWMMGEYAQAEPYLKTAFEAAELQGAELMDYNALMQADGSIKLPTDQLQHPENLYFMATMARLIPAMYSSYYAKAVFPIKNDVLQKWFKNGDTRLAFLTGLKSNKTAYSSFTATDIYAANINGMLTDIGVNVPDLYLMYAECLARGGKDVQAGNVLKELRIHRMDASLAAAMGTDLVVEVVNERIREYMGFGNLWFDMRRLWNDPRFQFLKAYYTHTDGEQTYTLTEDRLTMEIPPIVLSWHPEYKQ